MLATWRRFYAKTEASPGTPADSPGVAHLSDHGAHTLIAPLAQHLSGRTDRSRRARPRRPSLRAIARRRRGSAGTDRGTERDRRARGPRRRPASARRAACTTRPAPAATAAP